MVSIQILESSDVIEAGDFVRPLSLWWSEGGNIYTSATYGTGPQNNMKWVKVSECLEFWIGHTVWDYTENPKRSFCMPHEFARGDIPAKHILTLEEHNKNK